MKAASENLVPVTLELGGKSPVIIGDGADLTTTAKRVMMGKTMVLPIITLFAVVVKSAPSPIITGDFPPSSSVTGTRFSDAAFIISFPTFPLPVQEVEMLES